MTATDRAGYIDGLRALADLLEDNPTLALPFNGTDSPFSTYIGPRDGDAIPQILTWARAMDDVDVKVDSRAEHYGYELSGKVGGVNVSVRSDLALVGTPTVVGMVEKIDYLLPDLSATAVTA